MTLPAWMRSARFRIALMYSAAMFVLAAILVGTLYMALLASIDSEPVSKRWDYVNPQDPDATSFILADIRDFERQVNANTLDNLRQYSLGALGALFVTSLGVGWVISGRVLSPIDDIANVASDIQATDLSRRINLEGPEDELKRLADTFDRMLERLDDAFSMQRRFIADASHELRNPLAVIRTNLDVVMSDPHATPEELRNAAQVVRRSADRMSRLVDDLLALARLESPASAWERIDLASIVEEVTEEVRELARTRDVSVVMAGGGVTAVRGDRDALKRAATNLVDNALRFGPRGTSVVMGAGSRNGWAYLAVADQGPGLEAGERERVFERFYRTDRSRSRTSGGSGLGLAIVRQIARAHSGSATVHSRPGAGATFVVWLPLESGAPPVPPPDASPLESA